MINQLAEPSNAVERNKRTFRLLQEEVICNGRLDLVEQVFAPTFRAERAGLATLNRIADQPGYPGGNVYDAFISNLESLFSTLSEQHRTIDEINGEGNTVWARWTVSAVHAGEFMGRPATGNRIEFVELGQMRFDEEGRMTWGWFMCDELGLALALGIPVG